jgi:ubiquitin-activating enzyme E1
LIPESRYSDYIQLFGDDFVRKLQSSKSLLIGAGSLGNEFVEMLAMMGVSSKEGKIIVLDDSDV